jgi:hypothetical protein
MKAEQLIQFIRRTYATKETLSAEDISMMLWRDYRLDVSVEIIRAALR